MQADFDYILFTQEQIAARVRELAGDISRTYADAETDLTLVTILSGSLIFLADLIRELPIRMRIGLITVSSYRGPTTQPGDPRVFTPQELDVHGRHVLVLDDILDTGNTLRTVRAQLSKSSPLSIRTCVLLRKLSKAPADVPADFVGFDIREDDFVVGYGLDYNDLYRNAPMIGVLKPDLYRTDR